MRRRLVRNTILVSMMVLAVLATPVVLLLKRATEAELQGRLDAHADSIVAVIDEDVRAHRAIDVALLITMVPHDTRVVVSLNGVVDVQFGPQADTARHGYGVAVSGRVVDVSTDDSELRDRLTRQFMLLGVLAAGGVLLAAVLAAIFGARLTRPLEQLAASAGRLGAGDFSAALPPPSGIREIDDIRSTLSASASRLDQTLIAERSFTGDATHQLRTGLTGIALQLELLAAMHPDVHDDVSHALSQTDRMTATIDELPWAMLAKGPARGGRGGARMTVQLRDIASEHRGDWLQRYSQRKRLLYCSGSGSPVIATPGFVGQIIDILLDNALTHGQGVVTIHVSDRQLRVRDEGRIDAETAKGLFRGSDDPAAPHGRGLSLARRLAQADGGRLELTERSPTTLVVTYPAAV
ncbi:MAG TPA: HAMP domain-containing sensor histidine kinase [Ilumatobacteraceae bacterium]|nr:HAMP domain-containing sensor histidine kinase [Ilumatobacteraceae bacterium]